MRDVAVKASVETTDLIAVVINTPKSYHYYVVKNIEGIYKLKEEVNNPAFLMRGLTLGSSRKIDNSIYGFEFHLRL